MIVQQSGVKKTISIGLADLTQENLSELIKVLNAGLSKYPGPVESCAFDLKNALVAAKDALTHGPSMTSVRASEVLTLPMDRS